MNRLSGNIPVALKKFQMLRYLDISNNSLDSSIPQSFSELISIEVSNLSCNDLSGVIPNSFANLRYLVLQMVFIRTIWCICLKNILPAFTLVIILIVYTCVLLRSHCKRSKGIAPTSTSSPTNGNHRLISYHGLARPRITSARQTYWKGEFWVRVQRMFKQWASHRDKGLES